MIFRITIYVRTDLAVSGSYIAAPLFFPQMSRNDKNLSRLISRLARDLSRAIEEKSKAGDQQGIIPWAFHPNLSQHRLEFTIELRRRRVKTRYLLVTFQQMGKRLAFTPSIPDLWFEFERKSILQERASVVFNDYWRQRERDDEEVNPAEHKVGQAWIQTVELSVNISQQIPEDSISKFLSLGSDALPDGSMELMRVGRNLDWQYPAELDEAIYRDTEIDELYRLLKSEDRRPVLLCGPRLSGKTAILHEVVRRRVAERKKPFVTRSNVWLISPQRLISGMSYVGQWEARLLAILKAARKRDHVLYFDDLVGLFFAGISASSTLSAAQVLKPYLERRQIRVLGEITPEALRVLQERDRSFADLFHILPVRPTTDEQTLKILIASQRRLEGKHRTSFDMKVLPTVIDLTRRYERANSFPGKAARMLTRLAIKSESGQDTSIPSLHPLSRITRDTTLKEFQATSGLAHDFLDEFSMLRQESILNALEQSIIGQPEAINAAADVIAIAKARLNDPERPLAAFLFLGPTGVGKTECAKAIAKYLFGDADRLLRYDMNEYVNPGSAVRLVGNFSQPEGLLTSAIRRQPFAVVLLDEIEKADPEVFDLLLQVLGEGRLTDALGRTADFTNAIVVMTSNLGVREAEAAIGFRENAQTTASSYTRAAERFFRPEFFNRLDRIIPFRRLAREHLRQIAARLMNDVLHREGFTQRNCQLQVTDAAIEEVINLGFDPVLGARAMKRSIERQIIRPASHYLAAMPVNRFTVVDIDAVGGELRVKIQLLEYATQSPSMIDWNRNPRELLDYLDDKLSEVEVELERIRPTNPISSGKITLAQERYFAARDRSKELSQRFEDLYDAFENQRLHRLEVLAPSHRTRTSIRKISSLTLNELYKNGTHQHEQSLFSAIKLEEGLQDLYESSPELSVSILQEIRNQIALLRQVVFAPVTEEPVYLYLRLPMNLSHPWLKKDLLDDWGKRLDLEVKYHEVDGKVARLELIGIHAWAIAQQEEGTHLIVPTHGFMIPVQVIASRMPTIEKVVAFGTVNRIYALEGQTIDLRTGLSCASQSLREYLPEFILSLLPVEA